MRFEMNPGSEDTKLRGLSPFVINMHEGVCGESTLERPERRIRARGGNPSADSPAGWNERRSSDLIPRSGILAGEIAVVNPGGMGAAPPPT